MVAETAEMKGVSAEAVFLSAEKISWQLGIRSQVLSQQCGVLSDFSMNFAFFEVGGCSAATDFFGERKYYETHTFCWSSYGDYYSYDSRRRGL